MQWRRANKRQKRAPEYYLGDIVGKAPEPMRPIYRPGRRLHWATGWSHAIVALFAFLTFVALLIAFMVMLFLYAAAKPALAQTYAETAQQVRRDCRVDALHYCPKQSARCLLREDKTCTDAIIACMQINKVKLKPACARWMW